MTAIIIITSLIISVTATSIGFYKMYHQKDSMVNEIMSREEQYITIAIFYMIPIFNVYALCSTIIDLVKIKKLKKVEANKPLKLCENTGNKCINPDMNKDFNTCYCNYIHQKEVSTQ